MIHLMSFFPYKILVSKEHLQLFFRNLQFDQQIAQIFFTQTAQIFSSINLTRKVKGQYFKVIASVEQFYGNASPIIQYFKYYLTHHLRSLKNLPLKIFMTLMKQIFYLQNCGPVFVQPLRHQEFYRRKIYQFFIEFFQHDQVQAKDLYGLDQDCHHLSLLNDPNSNRDYSIHPSKYRQVQWILNNLFIENFFENLTSSLSHNSFQYYVENIFVLQLSLYQIFSSSNSKDNLLRAYVKMLNKVIFARFVHLEYA